MTSLADSVERTRRGGRLWDRGRGDGLAGRRRQRRAEGLALQRHRRRHRRRGRFGPGRLRDGIGGQSCLRLRIGWNFIRGCGRLTAAVEQRHRHLEAAEHDHDHACANQQRADLRADGRGLLGLVLAVLAPGAGSCRPCRPAGAAAAACAARRAAAMKLDELTGSRGAAGMSLIALSDAAMRSDGEAGRPVGRVPGSSG